MQYIGEVDVVKVRKNGAVAVACDASRHVPVQQHGMLQYVRALFRIMKMVCKTYVQKYETLVLIGEGKKGREQEFLRFA